MRYTELSVRMKSYEQQTTAQKLIPNLPVYCRIDGRAFHTFCRGLEKPFCMELVETMQEVCKFLVEETHALLGYVQSDEISLCWESLDKAPFEGKLFKLQSVLSSMAAVKFSNYITTTYFTNMQVQDAMSDITEVPSNEHWKILFYKCSMLNPCFDCRVFQLPNMSELANCFVWRELDAIRNSVSMLAQANFSHKQLQGKDKNTMITMLEEKGIHWNELRQDLKQGAYFRRVLIDKYLEDEIWDKIPDNQKPESRYIKRSEIQLYSLPQMSKIKNKVQVYFYGEEPVNE